MTVTIIDKNNGAAFQNLISGRIFSEIGAPDILALGAVDDGGLAAGALVCRMVGAGTMELIWMFVAENRRRQGMASMMFRMLADAMEAGDVTDLYCLFPDGEESEELRRFMERQDFSFAPEAEDMASVPFDTLIRRLRPFEKMQGDTMPLREIPRRYANRLLTQRKTRGKTIPLVPGDMDLSAFHSCSRSMMREGELIGLALFIPREEGDGAALVMVQAGDPSILARLLYDSAKAAAEMFPPGSRLTIATLDGFGRRMQKLLGDSVRPETLVCASYAV